MILIRDYTQVELREGYEIDKRWMRGYLDEQHELVLQSRKSAKQKSPSKEEPQIDVKVVQSLSKKSQDLLDMKIESTLFKLFDQSPEPFWLNLLLIENCKDFTSNKYNTSACIIAKLFQKWALKRADHALNEEIRKEAFLIGTKENLLILEYLQKPYKLDSDNLFLLELCKKKVNSFTEYKDKAIIVATLGFQDHFRIEDILLPLLLQDKLNILERYLLNSRSIQKEFLAYLDNMCHKDACIGDFIHRCEKIKTVRLEKLSRRNLSKLVTRLAKAYQIEAQVCPNVDNEKYLKNMRYLMYRRYNEKSLSVEPWRDLIEECLIQADYLTDKFMEMLADYQDYTEAAFWVNKLQIDVDSLSSYVRHELDLILFF